MRRRGHISLKTKLAATLCEMVMPDGNGGFVKIIPHDDAVKMSEDQVLSLFHFDHGLFHSQDGADDFWNLTPMLILPHRAKTRQQDIPQIAKTKRITASQTAFRERLLAKDRGEQKPRSKWASRPMTGRGKSSW